MYRLTLRPQCTLSLPPENIRKPEGFQGVEQGCIGDEWVNINNNNLYPGRREKINLHKTFCGTTKKCVIKIYVFLNTTFDYVQGGKD